MTAFATRLTVQMATLEASLANVARQIQQIRVPANGVEAAIAQQAGVLSSTLTASVRSFQSAIDDLKITLAEVAGEVRVGRKKSWWLFWQ